MGSHSERVRSAGAAQRERGPSGDEVRDNQVAVEVEPAPVETDGGGSTSAETKDPATALETDESEAAALEAEVDRLRSELARRETELATVVDRYERLLERRNHATDGGEVAVEPASDRGQVDWLARTVGRVVERLRRF